MYLCANFQHIITNFAVNMAFAIVTWLESHKCLYLLCRFVKIFFQHCHIASLKFFLVTSTHKMTPWEIIAFFELLFFFFYFLQNGVKMVGMTIHGKGSNRISQNSKWFLHIMTTCVPKNIF